MRLGGWSKAVGSNGPSSSEQALCHRSTGREGVSHHPPRRVLSNPSGGVLLGPWDVLLAGVGWCGRLPVGGWWGWFVGVELPRFGVAGGFGGLGGVECPAGGCVGESEVDEAS